MNLEVEMPSKSTKKLLVKKSSAKKTIAKMNFDDALSLQKLDGKNGQKEKTRDYFDDEAYFQFFWIKLVPMLPEVLSKVCSLRPNEINSHFR